MWPRMHFLDLHVLWTAGLTTVCILLHTVVYYFQSERGYTCTPLHPPCLPACFRLSFTSRSQFIVRKVELHLEGLSLINFFPDSMIAQLASLLPL